MEFNRSFNLPWRRREPRPVLTLLRTPLEKLGELAAALALLGGWVVPLWYWDHLPARVPAHFNIRGEADGWGPSWTLFLLPAIGVLMYLLLTAITRIPHRYNYPVAITEANAERQYRLGRGLVLALKVTILFLFAGLEWAICRGAEEGHLPGPWWTVLAVPVTIFGLLVSYLILSVRAK